MKAFNDGSNIVYASGPELIIKIFPPFHRHQFISERTVLAHHTTMPDVEIPQLVAEGELEDWRYAIISKVDGVTLNHVWSKMDRVNRIEEMARLGRIVRGVHSLDVNGMEAIDPNWPEFIEKQKAGCRTRQIRTGLPSHLLDQLDDFLDSVVIPTDQTSTLLLSEFTPTNLMMQEIGGSWRITGLIDFGDALLGFHEYDLLGPTLFSTAGDGELNQAFFEGYGLSREQINDAFVKRLMAFSLLHLYSDLGNQIAVAGWQEEDSFPDIARLIWTPQCK